MKATKNKKTKREKPLKVEMQLGELIERIVRVKPNKK